MKRKKTANEIMAEMDDGFVAFLSMTGTIVFGSAIIYGMFQLVFG